MERKLLEALSREPLDMQQLKVLLDISDGSSFVELNRILNSLMDEKSVVMKDGVYYLVENYSRGVVHLRHGDYYFVSEGSEEYEIEDAEKLCLMKDDEILYELKNRRASVISILNRNTVYVVGIVRVKKGNVEFIADERSVSRFRVSNTAEWKKKLHDFDKVRCYIASYTRKELRIDMIIGNADDADVKEKSILYAYDAPLSYPKKCIDEVKNTKVEISEKGRRDIRDDMIITIDGDDAKDYDDAIFVDENEEGYILKVSIADVSSYVKEGSAVDKEAFKRGTSIYYPGHVLPMLPFELSDDLCSLRPNEDRLALTCEIHYDFFGNRISYDIYPSIIRSHYRMTYNRVNAIFDNDAELKKEYKELTPMLFRAERLSSFISKRRKEKGGIDFESDECQVIEENGAVIDIRPRVSGRAESMIEDFMIEANVTVAQHMHYLDLPMVYRNHDLPKEDRIISYIDTLSKLGYGFKGKVESLTSRQLADSLEFFDGKPEYPIVSSLLLRSMSKALYETVSDGHFGMGLDQYCHFTSPIRRYPDLIVHRMLWKYVFSSDNYADMDKDSAKNEKAALQSNKREKIATNIERDIIDLKKCEYMKNHIGEVYEGVISSVTNFGLFVKLDNTVEGLVHISSLDGYYELDENENLSDGRTSYSLGQKVRIRVKEVSSYRGSIDFQVLVNKRNVRY